MSTPARLPTIFFGHGNPMNALESNAYTEGWSRIGRTIPRPKAVLAVSAHWYEAPGSPELAARVHALLAPLPVGLDQQWGLDHGR